MAGYPPAQGNTDHMGRPSSPALGASSQTGAPAGQPIPPRDQAPRTATPSASQVPAQRGTSPVGMPGGNDPAYLAYMRQLGVDEGNIGLMTGFHADSLQRKLGRALPSYAEQRTNAIRGAGEEAEQRGMFRSGRRITNQAQAGRDVDRERMDFEAGIRDQIGELYLNAAMDVANLRRQFLEQGYDAATANALANANAGL